MITVKITQEGNLINSTENVERNFSLSQIDATIDKILSEEEIIELWRSRDNTDELELAVRWIMKQPNYALSEITDPKLKLESWDTVVKFKRT